MSSVVGVMRLRQLVGVWEGAGAGVGEGRGWFADGAVAAVPCE